VKQRSKRQRLLAITLGLGLGLGAPASQAAENLVFVSGAFRRSLPVADLEYLATTGQARGLLAQGLALGKQNPTEVARMLNEKIPLPVALVSRLLNTRIGEAILERLARVIFPLNTPSVGIPALRSAMVIGIVDGKGSLSAMSFLRAYPNDNIEVSIPALMALMQKASSISDLVRFFSESPLDGLRGTTPPKH